MLKLSSLNHTWILDVDGTLVVHNGHLKGKDILLDGVREFFDRIPKEDKVILLTARKEQYLENLKEFLAQNNIKYDYLLTDMPMGERILVNDKKPSGLKTAFAINKNRDDAFEVKFEIDESL